MQQVETCFLCKKGIDLSKDNFLKIEEYNEGEHHKTLFAHKICYLEKINAKNRLQKMALNLGARTNKMLIDGGY